MLEGDFEIPIVTIYISAVRGNHLSEENVTPKNLIDLTCSKIEPSIIN